MWKSGSFLIISLETCVTDDFINSNRSRVKPTQSYTSSQTELYFVLSKSVNHSSGWERLGKSFQHFFASEENN